MDIKVVPNSPMQIDAQAEALKLNSVADRMMSEKGPFANIPPEVKEKFLLKYWQGYGITDAVYWVRAVQKFRKEIESEAKKLAKAEEKAKQEAASQVPPPIGPQSSIAPQMPPAIPTTDMIQSDQIAPQPSPLAQLIQSDQLPPIQQM